MALTLRLVKDSELSCEELDNNFVYLDNRIDELEQETVSAGIVRVTPQTFLQSEMDQALANIGGASVQVIEEIEDRLEFLESYQPVLYTPQVLTPQEQEVVHDNINVYSKEEVDQIASDLVQPKQKAIHVHTLTPADVSQATITLDLVNVPDVSEFYDLHVNGVYVNDDDYIVQANQVIIAKSNIAYEVQAGMKLTFRYRYV